MALLLLSGRRSLSLRDGIRMNKICDRSIADAFMTNNHFIPVEGYFNVQHTEFDWDYYRPELDAQLNMALSSLMCVSVSRLEDHF